jgi:hypothetical protein
LRLRIGEKPLKIGRNAACDVVVPDCSGLIFPDTPIGGKHLGDGKT